MKTIQIVWNGCDGYIESNEIIYKLSESWKPFDVVQLAMADVPRDADGELDFAGLYVTDAGNVYNYKELYEVIK